MSAQKNAYEQFTIKFPESYFPDIRKQFPYEHLGGRFREVDGELFISVFLGGNPKSSKQIQFIV
jgi:hypothetical protein